MAKTQEYAAYLNGSIDIAPANSQEELLAAEDLAKLMGSHGVEPRVEEFEAPKIAGLEGAIVAIAMFVGVFIAGFGVGILTFLGLVLALVPCVLAVLRVFGREVSLSVGPKAQSQNVVAVHRAEGPLVTKGSRPIVVVAHYDTPHENILYATPLASYLPMIAKASHWCVYAVALCAFIQILGFLPAAARIVFWLLGIVASVPGMILAVGAISERVTSCTLGANCNKSGVAAMLGVLQNVQPADPNFKLVIPERPKPQPVEAPAPAVEPVPAAEPVAYVPAAATAQTPTLVYEEVVGVRHGEDTLRELGILPGDCKIEYRKPQLVAAPAPVVPAAEAASADVTAQIDAQAVEAAPVAAPVVEAAPVEESAPVAEAQPERADVPAKPTKSELFADIAEPLAIEEIPDDAPEDAATTASVAPIAQVEEAEKTVPTAPINVNRVKAEAASQGAATREDLLATGRFSLSMDGDESDGRGVGEKDSSGLTAENDSFEEPRDPEPHPRPDAPSDPEWGRSNFRPQVSNMAKRASLFDLPDPSQTGVDPFGTDPNATRVSPSLRQKSSEGATGKVAQVPVAVSSSLDGTTGSAAPVPASAVIPTDGVVAPEPVQTIGGTSPDGEPKGGIRGFFARFKKSKPEKALDDSTWLGDDEESEDDPLWRGGATTRSDLRVVPGTELQAAPSQPYVDSEEAFAGFQDFSAPEPEDGYVDSFDQGYADAPAGIGFEEAAAPESPTEEELRDAALSLQDDALLAHDIWFVALGASSLDHAGMKAFLKSHKSEIRGCFLLNLDCVGAGNLSVLTNEGLEEPRRADRRLVRLVARVADDLHVGLEQHAYDWAETDATPAMRARRRSVTIVGLGENGLPALARTSADVEDSTSFDQAADVTAIVTELIRRS